MRNAIFLFCTLLLAKVSSAQISLKDSSTLVFFFNERVIGVKVFVFVDDKKVGFIKSSMGKKKPLILRVPCKELKISQQVRRIDTRFNYKITPLKDSIYYIKSETIDIGLGMFFLGYSNVTQKTADSLAILHK